MNDRQECFATGMFLNDDGNVLNTTGRQNIYELNFTATDGCNKSEGGHIFLNISQIAKADELPMMNATMNDFLGQIFIYNTNSDLFNMIGKYQVNVTYNDNSTQVLQQLAQFDTKLNQTIFTSWNSAMGDQGNKTALPLFNIKSMEFDEID